MLSEAAISSAAPAKHTWALYWDHPTPFEDFDEATVILDVAVKRRTKMLQILAYVVEHKGQAASLRGARRYLRSHSARLAALGRAYNDKIGRFRDDQFLLIGQLAMAADVLGSLTRITSEPFSILAATSATNWFTFEMPGLLPHALALLLEDVANVLSPLDCKLCPVIEEVSDAEA